MKLLPAHEKFSSYFNVDNGTGKIRGVYLQGNEAVRPIFREWLVPFNDLGAKTLTISNTGGTDHLSFDAVGSIFNRIRLNDRPTASKTDDQFRRCCLW